MPQPARVAVFGTGLTGTELVRACRAAGHELVAGVVTSEAKDGRDLPGGHPPPKAAGGAVCAPVGAGE